MPDVGDRIDRRGTSGSQPSGNEVPPDVLIARTAAAQHGLITVWQLLDLGLTHRMIRSRLVAGRLHRVHHGVYAVGYPPRTRDAHWLAAVLACGEAAILSHRSAAALWAIRASAATMIDVASPRRRGQKRPGLTVHRATSLTPADITERRAIPCTAVPRTLLDLAEVVHLEALEYTLHEAQSRKLVRIDEIWELLARSPGRRGAAPLRSLLGRPETLTDAEAKQKLERRFRKLCRDAGIPAPRSNIWIPLEIPAGGLEVDFCWPDQKLAVETDSRTFHATARAFDNDPQRDRALTLAGWRVVRFRWREVFHRPEVVVAQLRALLGLE
jgi:hypothetical protein